MDISREEKLREEFRNILFELAKSQELLQDPGNRSSMYKRLEALYYSKENEEKFRHYYSDIFTVLTQLQRDSSLGDMNILGQNLSMIRAGYQSMNKDDEGRIIDICDNIRKLYDHVSMDIARITYSDAADRKISGEAFIGEVQSQITQAKEEINTVRKVQQDVEEKMNNQQKEYIAILGVFSAVVLTFIGGIAFSTSVLENIAQASVYRTLIVALIIGVVLINAFFGMFYYVNLLINKQNVIKPIWISNIILCLLILGVVLAWCFGFVEQRNKEIKDIVNIPVETQIEKADDLLERLLISIKT